MSALRVANAREVRGCIAASMAPPDDQSRLGHIRLHRHQAAAVQLLKSAIARYGGALLCDPVGTGKTFTALAIAAEYPRAAVVAPAVLRAMWIDAARAAGVVVDFSSHEALSRSGRLPAAGGLLIVDEAHHARNPATKRFAALARMAHGSDVLLLTATPIHNHPRDMTTLLSLFLGSRAERLSPADSGAMVLRRMNVVEAAGLIIPRVDDPVLLDIECDDSIVELIVNLPPPLPAREGSAAHALIIHSLIRLWASSDAALRGALIRRSQRATALSAALEAGTYPSQAELSAWTTGEDAVQLAFPEIVATASGTADDLIPVIRAHADGIEKVLRMLDCPGSRDEARAAALREIRRRHEGVPVVAFSQYEDTISSFFRLLAPDGGVAALWGRAGRVAGGPVARRDIIERFAPRASGRPVPSRAEAVSLLLTTDLMSEGVNLQDAGVVIHLDLPFTPARIEQRSGRVARLGSVHGSVSSYVFRPPATAETVARIERLLDIKLSLAEESTSTVHATDMLRAELGLWSHVPCDSRVAAAVQAPVDGFIAAVSAAGSIQLLGSIDGSISDEPELLLRCVRNAGGADVPVEAAVLQRVIRDIRNHTAVIQSLGPDIGNSARRRILRRVGSLVRGSRPHSRARIESLAQQARRIVAAPGDALSDLELTGLAGSDLPDHEWLEALTAHCAHRTTSGTSYHADLVAILLLRKDAR